MQRPTGRRRAIEAGDLLRVGGVALLLLGAAVAALLRLAPLWLLAAYLMLGLVSFIVYGFDKRAARNGDWRVSEASLHGIDLIGGIAGALLAQVVFRHKTRKHGFVVATGLITALHLGALSLLLLGVWQVPALLLAV